MNQPKCTVTAVCRDGKVYKLNVPEIMAEGIRPSDVSNLRNVDHIVVNINFPVFRLRAETISKFALLDVPIKFMVRSQ